MACRDATHGQNLFRDGVFNRAIIFVREINNFFNAHSGDQLGTFITRKKCHVETRAFQVAFGMQNSIGLRVYDVSIFLLIKRKLFRFVPRNLGFINPRNLAVITHTDLMIFAIDKNTTDFGAGIFAFKTRHDSLEHEVFIPIEFALHD